MITSKGIRVAALCAVMLAVAAPAAFGSPKSLYLSLLTSKFAPLPDGFYTAKVGTDEIAKVDKKHHVVGRVLVTIDSEAAIQYGIFRSWQDARGRFNEKPQLDKGVTAKVIGKVPGFRIQSKWINGSITGKNAFGKTVTNGVTSMCARSDAVTVCAVTVSTDNEQSGDVPGAIKLLRSGIAHLENLKRKQ